MTAPTDKPTLLEFPCDFPIKAVGKNSDDFEVHVRELITPHLHDGAEPEFKVRPSKAGQYISVTITIEAHSQKQLDAIYHSLSASSAVLMAL